MLFVFTISIGTRKLCLGNVKSRKRGLDLAFSSIPTAIYVLIVSLIALVILSMVYKKLNLNTLTMTEYMIEITTTIGVLLLFLSLA